MLSGQKLKSVNPATGEVIGEVPVSTLAEVEAAITMARKAQPVWQALGVEGRIAALRKLHDDFKTHGEELAALVAREMGSPITANLKVMETRLAMMRWNLDRAAEILAPETTFEDAKSLHQIHYEPYGVFGVIAPWNVPFSNFVRTALQPLIAGNTVVFKFSEEIPLFAMALSGAFTRTMPQGVFAQVYGAGDVGEALMKGGIDHIHFTGSTVVGQKLYKIAAEKFIPITLELGGSDAGIAFEDADIDRMVPAIFRGRFNNCGQVCSALKRLFVHESRYDELVTKLTAFIKMQKVGDPLSRETVIGPLVSEKQRALLVAQVDDAKAKGAKILLGGDTKTEGKGAFFEPTVITGLKPGMRAATEELFGPVLPVTAFKTEGEAVRLANDSVYGLSAYVYTEDRARFRRVALLLQAGTVMHNGVDATQPANPFGGYKYSGLGRSGGKAGLQSCCQIKVMVIEK